MTDDLNHRPGTLAEAIRRYKSGRQTFSVALGEMLDEFYMDGDKGGRLARLQDPPECAGDKVFDAYAGAVGRWFADGNWDLLVTPAALAALLAEYQPESSVVFCNTRRDADDVAESLGKAGIAALALHGDIDQRDRDEGEADPA